MYEDIRKVLEQDYDHEIPDIPRSKDFHRLYKKYVKQFVKPYGYEVICGPGNSYCGCSGFIKSPEGKFVYFISGDYRYDGDRIFDRVLIRNARYEKDYTGGGNYFCALKDIGDAAQQLFTRGNYCGW